MHFKPSRLPVPETLLGMAVLIGPDVRLVQLCRSSQLTLELWAVNVVASMAKVVANVYI